MPRSARAERRRRTRVAEGGRGPSPGPDVGPPSRSALRRPLRALSAAARPALLAAGRPIAAARGRPQRPHRGNLQLQRRAARGAPVVLGRGRLRALLAARAAGRQAVQARRRPRGAAALAAAGRRAARLARRSRAALGLRAVRGALATGALAAGRAPLRAALVRVGHIGRARRVGPRRALRCVGPRRAPRHARRPRARAALAVCTRRARAPRLAPRLRRGLAAARPSAALWLARGRRRRLIRRGHGSAGLGLTGVRDWAALGLGAPAAAALAALAHGLLVVRRRAAVSASGGPVQRLRARARRPVSVRRAARRRLGACLPAGAAPSAARPPCARAGMGDAGHWAQRSRRAAGGAPGTLAEQRRPAALPRAGRQGAHRCLVRGRPPRRLRRRALLRAGALRGAARLAVPPRRRRLPGRLPARRGRSR